MKPPKHHVHPCNPRAVVYGVELEPGDAIAIGDVFSGGAKIGEVPTARDRRLSSGKWIPLNGWLANQFHGRMVTADDITSWVRPSPEPCSGCTSVQGESNSQCAQHPTRTVP